MRVFRIERKKYLKSTLSGLGASQTEGCRWNGLNTRLVYTAASRALATLEISVHLDISEDLPTDRYYVEIEIPDGVSITELKDRDLPKNWDSHPPINETQLMGDDFVLSGAAAVLKVRSAIVPPEYNYLINPAHPDAGKITVVSTEPVRFDKRLKEGK